jgi:hypothetical protein
LAAAGGPAGGYHPGYLFNRLKNNVSWLVTPRTRMAKMRMDLNKVEAIFSLPRTRARVGQARIDHFGCLPGWVLLNHLNYWPRPMPISFAAWNPALARANEGFYRNPLTAPEFVLAAINPVRDQCVLLDDALALRALLDNYHPVLMEGDLMSFLLLERNPPPLRERAEKKLLSEFTTGFAAPLPLEERSNEPVWMEVEIKHSWLGSLLSFFYKPRPCYLAYKFVGDPRSYWARFATSIGGAGCLLTPFIGDTRDLLKFYRPGNDLNDFKRIESFGFFCDPGDEKFFQKDIHVRLYSVPRPSQRVELPELAPPK